MRLITAPYSYAVHPDPTAPPSVGMSIGVSNHCAMWSNTAGAIWTSATDHGIGVSPVDGHCCQECRGSECCEHDSAHLWPRLNLGEKKPRQLAGASSAH